MHACLQVPYSAIVCTPCPVCVVLLQEALYVHNHKMVWEREALKVSKLAGRDQTIGKRQRSEHTRWQRPSPAAAFTSSRAAATLRALPSKLTCIV